jgi:hypothetical protein
MGKKGGREEPAGRRPRQQASHVRRRKMIRSRTCYSQFVLVPVHVVLDLLELLLGIDRTGSKTLPIADELNSP